jgi:hypothetical protein
MSDVTFLAIVQGEDRTLSLRVTRSDEGSFDLTGVTGIEARFLNEDLSILSRTIGAGSVVVTDAPAGKFTVTITDTQSSLLKYSELPQSFSVVFDFGTTRRIVNFTDALLVNKKLV